MEVLVFFQNIRNPVLNKFFSFLTFFGEETFMIVLICLFAWCLNKELALRLGFVFSFGMIFNQVLKITFCVPRPWLRYDISPYEGAIKGATGYSFPSAHTQIASTVYTGIADFYKRKKMYIFAFLFSVLIGISRMYFGVHTLTDVLAGLFLGILCVLVFGIIYDKYKEKSIVLFIIGIIFTVAFLLYAAFKKYPADVEAKLVCDCFKLGGLLFGFFSSIYLERKYLNYSVDAVLSVQIIKFVVGLSIMISLKLLFKIFTPSYILYIMEYFLLALWCLFLYPLIFSKFILWRSKK